MKGTKTAAALIVLLMTVFTSSCRKDKSGGEPAIRLSVDSLKVMNAPAIPLELYTDITFTSETTGYAIANNGIIIKTIDGGRNWTSLASPAAFFLKAIQFTDAQTGYIIGGDQAGSYLLKTTNAGATWTIIDLDSPKGGIPTGLYFTDNNKGFITGPHFFIKTSDGGTTWSPVINGNNADFYDVKFNRAGIGLATAAGGVYYRSSDRGSNWKRVETGAANQLREIVFGGSEIYIKVGGGLFNTVPGRASIVIPPSVQKLYYVDNNVCIGIGQHYENGFWPYGDIFITNNNWNAWTSRKFMPEEALSFSAMARISDRKFMMLGRGHLKMSVVTLFY